MKPRKNQLWNTDSIPRNRVRKAKTPDSPLGSPMKQNQNTVEENIKTASNWIVSFILSGFIITPIFLLMILFDGLPLSETKKPILAAFWIAVFLYLNHISKEKW